jgi:D-lactate dehydrogenase (cytochrome)
MRHGTSLSDKLQYLSDEGSLFRAEEGRISAIHFPETESEVIGLIDRANEDGEFITMSGGGTGITGARVPVHGGAVISLERFNTPKGAWLGDSSATLPPGISLTELESALPASLIYPPDPTEKSAFIGGTVATNASGARCFYYGPTREWVEGLRVVLGDGEVLDIRRGDHLAVDGILDFSSESGKEYSVNIPSYTMPQVKNTAGVYAEDGMDLIDLFIGSEGIFGVFTEIRVKLKERPDMVSDIAFFTGAQDALAYVNNIRDLRDKGLLSLEYFDDNSLEFMRNENADIKDGLKAAVFVEITRHEDMLANISELQKKHNACEDWCAVTSADARDLKELRHALPDGINTYLREHESYKLGTDFVVPAENFDKMLAQYLTAGRTYKKRHEREGMHYVLFGHIGDHHLHFNFITHTDEERTTAKELYAGLAKQATSFGGTISGEHGVGKKTLPVNGKDFPYLQLMYGEAGLREIARIKKTFDPNGVLNIGNMIPMEYLL